jgi:hypothetical protein
MTRTKNQGPKKKKRALSAHEMAERFARRAYRRLGHTAPNDARCAVDYYSYCYLKGMQAGLRLAAKKETP